MNLYSLILFSQKEASIWYFGKNAGLDFNNSQVTALLDSEMAFALEASGTMSDNSGKLRFYTDGQTVWNKNHSIMEGGIGLEGSEDASQSGLILNHPDNDSVFYIFLTPFSANYTQ